MNLQGAEAVFRKPAKRGTFAGTRGVPSSGKPAHHAASPLVFELHNPQVIHELWLMTSTISPEASLSSAKTSIDS
jgi:hypothetical protein